MEEHTKKTSKLSAFDRAMNYLTYRDRTEAEMVKYLQDKKYSEKEIAAGMEALIRYGYIDDERYIKNACELNKSSKRYSRRRLAQDLIHKGIPREKIEDIDLFFSEEEEERCCEELIDEAFERYRNEHREKRSRKVANWMMRRGYSYAMIRAQISRKQEMCAENVADDEEETQRNHIEADYQKYLRMQRLKGYTGWELQMRVQRNLLSRGFPKSEIYALIDEKKQEGEFDE